MKSKKYRLLIITGLVVFNSIGLSLVLPLLPFLVGKYLPARQVPMGMGLLMSVFAACTFFAAPVFGALSDRFGRKNILIISLAGSVVGYILFGIGGSLPVLFAGRIIDGLTAGNITILFAYISDVTRPDERAKWFGYVGAAMGIGKIGGPALGGLLGSISIGLPFFVTAGLILLSIFIVYFLLPESLAPEDRTTHLSINSFNTFSHLKDVFSLRRVKVLLISGALFYLGVSIFQLNYTIFLKDIYHWGPASIGSVLTFVGIFEIVTRAVALPWLLKRADEKNIAISGLIVLLAGLSLVIVSIYQLSAIIVCLSIILIISGEGLFDPIFTSRLSGSVDENEQGKLQGVNQSLQSANNVLIPLGAAALYVHNPVWLYTAAVAAVASAALVYVKFIR